ncbi:CaiB/BaiF CoA transferase family protein [Desulfatitalea tepidiphila]|uniref:CaiB/BaiF CoA transferase family protein n=1 Tax=Desulfatitalea tepidiphila TaxID=1185843 RepID=UPI0013792B4B|nr:CoA transferase [Desulfatitalea tepidiphila]
MEKKEQVFSKHMTGKKTRDHLDSFNNLLKQMMAPDAAKKGPLDGLNVIELGSANFPGLICGAMLGEMGAHVIKIEPQGGDPAREATYSGIYLNGAGIPFVMESRNKCLVTADIEEAAGLEKIISLASKSDIVIDAMQPGYLDFHGAGYRSMCELNPGLIYAALSPYGHFTSKAKEARNIPDTDLTAQAESGYPALTGSPEAPEPYNFPLRAGIWTAAYTSAAVAVAGILTALLFRIKTGRGQMVDVATYDALSTWQPFSLVWGFTNEEPRKRIGNFDWCLFPYGYYKAKDGYVTVAASSDSDFRGLLKILGRWDLEDDWRFLFDRIADDPEKLNELEREIKKEIAKFTRKELFDKTFAYGAKAARDKLRSKGFPMVVETRTPQEAAADKHWEIRRSFVDIEAQGAGIITLPALPPRMSETPTRINRLMTALGADNDYIWKDRK